MIPRTVEPHSAPSRQFPHRSREACQRPAVVCIGKYNARHLEQLDGLKALNVDDVVFVPALGQAMQGEAVVRIPLERFLGMNLPISMTVRYVFQKGNTGLAIADWTVNGTDPDGLEIALADTTANVAVYDEQLGWRYVIDNSLRCRRSHTEPASPGGFAWPAFAPTIVLRILWLSCHASLPCGRTFYLPSGRSLHLRLLGVR